ncbi:hypothetical protein ACJX0J_038611, partial [Zea mays]
ISEQIQEAIKKVLLNLLLHLRAYYSFYESEIFAHLQTPVLLAGGHRTERGLNNWDELCHILVVDNRKSIRDSHEKKTSNEHATFGQDAYYHETVEIYIYLLRTRLSTRRHGFGEKKEKKTNMWL